MEWHLAPLPCTDVWAAEKQPRDVNNVHETIKFTVEKSKKSIDFLDTTVRTKNRELETSLFVKPTDRNNYLPFDSAHPYSYKKGLPYGQFLRIHRKCSNESDYTHHCVKKATQMRQKGYSIALLTEAYTQAMTQDRTDLLKPRETVVADQDQNTVRTFLTTTYTPSFDGLTSQVRKSWDLLDRSNSTQSLHEQGLTVRVRRPKNLRDMLVKACLPPINESKSTDIP